ncbi:helix-turn-helix domain-containing protein [Nocardia farcinica]|nr:helix-turn-helix domain-containing protein [Nocardia farcinica]MBF6363181.1 helix-turn-helix domain-containing protein [Nocardia farcinica]
MDTGALGREYLTTREVAELTGVPVGTLRYWRHIGVGPASFSLRKKVVYRRSVLLKWIAKQEEGTSRGETHVA